jgi:hypothetical protein
VWLVAAATVVPIVVLTVLGGRVLEQDRAVEAERERETLEVTGLRIALDIDRALGDIEAGLARGEGIVFAGTGFTAPADAPLLYQPSVRAPFVPPAAFVGAEILSHGTRRRDEGLKRRLYERSGVREYWLVDPDHATIAIHRQTAAGRLSAADHLSSDKQDQLSSPLLPGFELVLAELFHAGPQT